jgi:hypothetical protein
MRATLWVLLGACLVAGNSGLVRANDLDPPAGNHLAFTAFGDGVQIYRSVPDPKSLTGFSWEFVAPRATLYTDETETEQLGIHYAGPTWEAEDGSTVKGSVLVRCPSPNPDSIPLLLLEAVDHSGDGIMSDVTYIQRLDTVGGIAPSELPTEKGQEAEVSYTATYAFYVADD